MSKDTDDTDDTEVTDATLPTAEESAEARRLAEGLSGRAKGNWGLDSAKGLAAARLLQALSYSESESELERRRLRIQLVEAARRGASSARRKRLLTWGSIAAAAAALVLASLTRLWVHPLPAQALLDAREAKARTAVEGLAASTRAERSNEITSELRLERRQEMLAALDWSRLDEIRQAAGKTRVSSRSGQPAASPSPLATPGGGGNS